MLKLTKENAKTIPPQLTVIWCKECVTEFAVRCWDDYEGSNETCPECGTDYSGLETEEACREAGNYDSHCDTLAEHRKLNDW